MPARIFLPPDGTGADVIEIGGECYERVGDSENAPTVSAADEEFDSCEDCEGSSSSSSGESCCVLGNDCEYSEQSTVQYAETLVCISDPSTDIDIDVQLDYVDCGVWEGEYQQGLLFRVSKTSSGWDVTLNGGFRATWRGTGNEGGPPPIPSFTWSSSCESGSLVGLDELECGVGSEISYSITVNGNQGCDGTGGLP